MKLVEKIKAGKVAGKTKEQIYLELLQASHKVSEIESAYKLAEKEASTGDTHNRTVAIILGIGALLVGSGIFSFVAANWDGLEPSMKLVIILAGMVASYTLGWFLSYRQKLPKAGRGLMLVGGIIYGAGIFLIGQIFNVSANWPDGFIIWMTGVVISAWLLESKEHAILALLTATVALIGHPFIIFGAFGPSRFLGASSLWLIVGAIITGIAAWRLHALLPQDVKNKM